MSCGDGGAFWPKPTGHLSLGKTVIPLDPDNISLTGISVQTAAGNLLQRNVELLKANAKKLGSFAKGDGSGLVIRIDQGLDVNDAKLTLNTDEGYALRVAQIDGRVRSNVPRARIMRVGD